MRNYLESTATFKATTGPGDLGRAEAPDRFDFTP
jgi:hypothetical protein